MVTAFLSDDPDVAMLDSLSSRNSSAFETIKISGEIQLSIDLIEDTAVALDRAEAAGAVLLLHLEGVATPAAWPGESPLRLISKWEGLLRRIERTPVPVIALAQGCFSSIALELLLVADYRVVTGNFVISANGSPEAAWPGMVLYRLAHQLGQARAKRLILRTAALSAEDAHSFDLVDHVAENGAAARDHISEMLKHAPLDDFAVRRRLIQDAAAVSFEEALGAHLAACDRSLRRIA